jgi:AcrR family transcriptional regulator
MAKRGETKKRIVEGAREAFNALRYGQVTTAVLAERLGVSEGNLWYHFKTKRALLSAIQADFAADTRAQLDALAGADDPVDAYCEFLKAWRDLFSRYLFVFRDRGEYGAHSPDMIAAFPSLYETLEAQVAALFRGLAASGKLAVDEAEIPDLVVNTILVTRYFLEFQEERLSLTMGEAQARSEDAVLHHLTLLQGRLDPTVEAIVRQALKA